MASTPNAQFRTRARRARRALTADDRDRLSAAVTQRFLQSASFYRSQTIGCYLSADDEVDTSAIIERAWRAKKRLFTPCVRRNHKLAFVRLRPETNLVLNRFGLWEPAEGAEISARDLDVCITPVVAFDDCGHRIGMGGGYYDRAFAWQNKSALWRRPKLVGLAFDCQRVEKIRPNPWDIPLYRVFTELT